MTNDQWWTKIDTEHFGNELHICLLAEASNNNSSFRDPLTLKITDLYLSCTVWYIQYTPLIRRNRKLAVQFPIFSYWNVVHFPYLPKGNVQHNVEGAAWVKCSACGCGWSSKVLELCRPDGPAQQLLGRAHLSALLSTVKLHQTEQLTSLSHKTWQQLIRLNLWSHNPICEILL